MNFELFVARRIHFNKKGEKRVSRPAVRIATGGIAISLTVMLLAVGIVVGFKQEVRNKLIGFGSHIQITSSFSNQTYETHPLLVDTTTINSLRNIPEVKHVQQFSTQPGIIKVDENFQGIVLKGVDKDFNWDFFKKNLKEGDIFQISDSVTDKRVIISKKLSDMLKLHVGDNFATYFIIKGKVRVRPMIVQGIYSTGFSDYDKLFIVGDMKHIRKLNNWEENQSSGIEILIDDYQNIQTVSDQVFNIVGNKYDSNGNYYMIKSIQQINPQIFNWLDLLDMNAFIILMLMILVAGFTMISGLLILILERTNMIGILKALGSSDWSIRRIFLYHALFLVGKGMLIGNIIGLSFCFLQQKYGFLTLDPETYYVDTVPIHLSIMNVLLINVGTFLISILMLTGPSYLITKISPIKSIRFE